jgi:glycosyltransferase involved in cell wall biosynthesis
MDVGVVIPAYCEEKKISLTIRELKKIPWIKKIVVVDDGSSDRTSEVARNENVDVIKLNKNYGKGYALNTGIKEIKEEIILTIDADLCESAKEVEKLLIPIFEDRADVVIAKFKKTEEKSGFGLVKKLAKFGIKKLTGLDIEFPLSGQRAIKREVIEKVGKFAEGFGCETGLIIDAYNSGFRIIEVETEMTQKPTGRNFKGFLHRGKQFYDIMKVLVKRWKI